ncbi:MAG: hypothetical protein R3A52_06490 [Polyangiales bacterium]
MSTTSTPSARSSTRSASESDSTAYFVALYAPKKGKVMRPPTLLTFSTRPFPRASIFGRNARVTDISPKTLVSNCARRSSSVTSAVGAMSP